MIPLRISAFLRTAVVSDPWLPLDGTLYWAAMSERGAFDGDRPAVPGDLPLETHGEGDGWYFACSFAQPQPWWRAEGLSYWNKFFDLSRASLVDFRGRRGLVMNLGGSYKAKHMPTVYRVTDRIVWYAVGNPYEIRGLLAGVLWLGKHTAQGWGRVARWTVEPADEDWSVWRDGELMRAVPWPESRAMYMQTEWAYYGLRPPYYLRSHLRDVVIRGRQVRAEIDWYEAADRL